MPLEKLSLSHQRLLSGRLKNAHSSLSEFSFANLYLFRNTHDHRLLADDGTVYVTGKTYDGFNYLMPTADVRTAGVNPLARLLKEYDFAFPVPEAWLPAFAGGEFRVGSSDGDSDYIFRSGALSAYRGGKLHGPKNLLKQFVASYSIRVLPLTLERMKDALNILEAWQSDMGESRIETDYFPCTEALELYEELILCGFIYYADGEPVGFIIGEELDPGTFALHFAKAKRKFKGIYQYMYNHFAGVLSGKYEFLNFEQDLGKPALRHAKASYQPERLIRKYRVGVRTKDGPPGETG